MPVAVQRHVAHGVRGFVFPPESRDVWTSSQLPCLSLHQGYSRVGCAVERFTAKRGWSETWQMVLTVLFSDKDADVPVLCTTGAYGSRRLENVLRCRRCSSAWLGRLVTMQRLFGVDGDGAVEEVFRRIFTAFFGLLFGVEAPGCQFMLRVC